MTLVSACALSAVAGAAESFRVTMDVDLDGARTNEVLYTAGAVTLRIRPATTSRYDRIFGNYVNFPLPDGSCPVLEATICEKGGRVGIPLGALKRPGGVHCVALELSPVHWTIVVDERMDEDIPATHRCAVVCPKREESRILSPRVRRADFVSPAPDPGLAVSSYLSGPRPIARPIQYWTPDDHNAWVGDVSLGTFRNRLHVFYLYDRRHHASGGGLDQGRHFFAHLSTDDLLSWREDPAAVPIEKWYECCGTGSPFVWRDRLCLAYGLHTGRITDDPSVPVGGFYAESEDGVRFRKTGVCISRDQNPSVYNRSDGRLGIGCGDGLWVARGDDLANLTASSWTRVAAPEKSGGDCPAPFEWHGHHYLMQGFHWFNHSTDGVRYEDWTARGYDIYEGLGVPTVVTWKDDRRILAGWLFHIHWFGGWLVFRELVWHPDGRLGTRWVPEIRPPGEIRVRHVDDPRRTFHQRFANAAGEQYEFRIDPSERRAQFADVRADASVPRAMSIRDRHAKFKPTGGTAGKEDCTLCARSDFAIEELLGIDRPYDVRFCVWYDRKSDATIFDVEIAGERTLIARKSGKWEMVARLEDGVAAGSAASGSAGLDLQRQIDAASARGGGRVVVGPGVHPTGQLDLRSNVELHLSKGAVLKGLAGLVHYRVTTLPYSEGTWSAVVSAIGVTNVAVTGEGTIDGDGSAWPQPTSGGDREGARARGLFFANCRDVRLEDFTLRDAACWGCVFKCCDGVVARRVRIDSHANANNDGFDIEAKNVLVEDCDVDSGDDACRVRDVTLENVALVCRGSATPRAARVVPGDGDYPECTMFGNLPAYGLYVEKTDGLELKDVRFTLPPGTADGRVSILTDATVTKRNARRGTASQ